MIQLVDPLDLPGSNNVAGLIFGRPGSHKTSLANTAARPILPIVFDVKGYKRSWMAQDAWRPANWEELLRETTGPNADLSEFRTVIVDTVAKQMDFLAEHVAAASPKNRSPLGGLSRGGWGVMGRTYKEWLLKMMETCDVILLAHDNEPTDDEAHCAPQMPGRMIKPVVQQEVDFMGWTHATNEEKYAVTFVSSLVRTCKDPAGLGTIAIDDDPALMEKIIERVRQANIDRAEERRAQAREIGDLIDRIEESDAEGLTALVKELMEDDSLRGALRKAAKGKIDSRAAHLQVKWDVDVEAFAPAADVYRKMIADADAAELNRIEARLKKMKLSDELANDIFDRMQALGMLDPEEDDDGQVTS